MTGEFYSRDEFAVVPRKQMLGRPPFEQLVFYHLFAAVMQQDGWAQPTIAELAADCCISDVTVRKALDGLIAAGMVIVEPQTNANGSSAPNRYRIPRPPGVNVLETGVNVLDPVHSLTRTRTSSTTYSRTHTRSFVHTILTKEEEKTESLGIQEESRPSIDVRWVLNEYNAIAMAVGFPVAKVESASRARMISARLKEFPEAEWRAMFDALRKSTHLTKEKWFIGIDWICSSTQHFEKVRAGWMDWAQQIKGPSNRLSTENSGSLVQQLREQGKVTL